MRLIDADALYELLDGGYDLDFDEVPETKRELLRMISEQPTIEERKKGEWINGSDERFVKCSKCGMETTRNELQGIALFGKEEPNYCPNCGADMRGGSDGT